jgi:hypothetical protein
MELEVILTISTITSTVGTSAAVVAAPATRALAGVSASAADRALVVSGVLSIG